MKPLCSTEMTIARNALWTDFGSLSEILLIVKSPGAGAQALERPIGRVHRKIVPWRCLARVWRMPGLPTQLPWRHFVCVLRKLGYTAQKGKAGCGNPTWETTSARQCCVSIFANLFSTPMSSCTF